jgi:surfactin synthase thioesterase subunit
MTSRALSAHVMLGPADAPHRVLLLHYAGGSAASLLPLARALPDGCAVALLEANDREAPVNSFTEAVTRLTPDFESLVDRPTTVFGHSLGALLAHALVMGLPAERRSLLRDVVLSGSRSPATTSRIASHPQVPFTNRSRAELIRDLDRYGGCPPEVFVDPHMLNLAVTALGQDLQLVDTYRATTSVPADHAPETGAAYHVWYGADDEEASIHEARRWVADLPRPPRLRSFPGGHFYLLEHPEAAGRALRHLVTTGDGSR